MSCSKTVNVEIGPNDLKGLKSYKLCIAKKVNDNFNVVWKSTSELYQYNPFNLESEYQIFCTSKYEDKENVIHNTNVVNINLGQIIKLDQQCCLGEPTGGGDDKSITLVNNYGTIYPGLSIKSNDEFTPIFVDPTQSVKGKVELVPAEQVLIWFEQDVDKGTLFRQERLFSDARSSGDATSRPFEVDLTGKKDRSVLYKNGDWSLL